MTAERIGVHEIFEKLNCLQRLITATSDSRKNLFSLKYVRNSAAYLGIQLGGVRSTSQVANSFIGTGLKDDKPPVFEAPPVADPSTFWLPPPRVLSELGFEAEGPPAEVPEAMVEANGVGATPEVILLGFKLGPPVEPAGGRNPLETKLAIQHLNSLFRG